MVVDEYGSVSGLVSQEDVIETLLGLEIMDESDSVADLQALARKSWKNRAKRMATDGPNGLRMVPPGVRSHNHTPARFCKVCRNKKMTNRKFPPVNFVVATRTDL